MILGLNLLVVLVVGGSALILALEQRNAVLRLHETAVRQTRVAVLETVKDVQQVLVVAGTADPPDLDALLAAFPALHAISLLDADGVEVAHVPAGDVWPAREWGADPAWPAMHGGSAYAALVDQPPVLVIAAPAVGGGVLVAEADPAVFWESSVAPPVGQDGYVYLVSGEGMVLAGDSSLDPAERLRPAGFAVFEKARRGKPSLRVYRGLHAEWVVGRAAPVSGIPGLDVYAITETPVTEFTPVVVRALALLALALGLTVVMGEWLIRRILRTVVGPLDTLRQGARAVMAGDYRYRVRVPPNTDRELVELGSTFNAMIERLADGQRQIDAYAHEMQEIVDLRARELSRKATQLEIAADVSSAIATILDPRDLPDRVVDLIRERFNVYYVELLLVDDQTGQIVPARSRRQSTPPGLTLHDANHSVIAWVARHGQTLYVPDVTQDERYRPSPDLPASRSELALPLRSDDRVIGVLNLEAEHRDAFPKDEIAVLESLANDIATSVHNAQVFDALETANRDLAQATLQANQANTLKSRFLLNASLKLRQPLDNIIGYSETIFSGIYGDLPADVMERQRRILESGRVLQALIEDMLDLSNIETGEMQLKLEWVNLPPLLEEVMNATRALHQTGYADHDLALRLDLMHLTEPLPPVWADIDRLRYILINLMGNAVKFTQSGEVVMSADFDEERVRIHVQDTGPGIGDVPLRYLFEPFQHQRGKVPPAGKGTGLGLPVSRLLAMRHGGDLTVTSVLHEGSTFTLNLPRHPDGAPPPPPT